MSRLIFLCSVGNKSLLDNLFVFKAIEVLFKALERESLKQRGSWHWNFNFQNLLFFSLILINWSNKSNFFLPQALLHSLLIGWFVSVDGLDKADASTYSGKKKYAAHVAWENTLNKTHWWALTLITSCPKSLTETTYKVAELYNIDKNIKRQ